MELSEVVYVFERYIEFDHARHVRPSTFSDSIHDAPLVLFEAVRGSDIAAVVLDVAGFNPSGERRALAICRALVRRRLSDACKKDFGDVSTALKLLPALVHALDGELGRLLFRPDDLDYALLLEPLWALSWAVTLFAHNVDDRASLVVLCSAEINQCVRPAWRYYLLFWPPRRSARVLGALARGVLGLLTRTFDFRTGLCAREGAGAQPPRLRRLRRQRGHEVEHARAFRRGPGDVARCVEINQ